MTTKSLATARAIRIHTIKMIHRAGSGHPGGSLSCADILACLYTEVLREGDKVVLSKGHSAPALYAALACAGHISVEDLESFRQAGGLLQGHPSVDIPGVDAPSGSLGMGLSQGLGMAMGARYTDRDARVYVIIGDGDMQEGATWEAIMAAGHYRMSNLTVILDNNNLQGDGYVSDQMDYRPIQEKIFAHGWKYLPCDGHDHEELTDKLRMRCGSPIFIDAETTKGKGVPFMEGDNAWHGSRGLTDEEYEEALCGL